MADLNGLSKLKIRDLRHENDYNLRSDILESLSWPEKELPSILLWDDKGLALFEKLRTSHNLHYYVTRNEEQILNQNLDSISSAIPDDCMIVELGSGNIEKALLILRRLQQQQKHIEYCALDISAIELRKSLRTLLEEFSRCPFITCQGLQGTYEDGLSWLSTFECVQKNLVFLWLGNSIGNLTSADASRMLKDFKESLPHKNVQFLVGLDNCQDLAQIMKCYNPADGPKRGFLMNGLEHANQVLGGNWFQETHFFLEGSFDTVESSWNQYFVAKRPVKFDLDGKSISIAEKEKIVLIRSGKWSEANLNCIARVAGFRVSHSWKTNNHDYGLFMLSQAKS